MTKTISKLEDYRKLSIEELSQKSAAIKAEYQTLRNEIAMNKSHATAKAQKLRNANAQVRTILKEKMILSQLENVNGEA